MKMVHRLCEALSQDAEQYLNKLLERDPHSLFIDFLKKIKDNSNFAKNTLTTTHLTVLQDLVKKDTLNLTEEWLLNPKIYTGDYGKAEPFRYLCYVLNVIYDDAKFRQYYPNLTKEQARDLKEKVKSIPNYKELQNLIQEYDKKQKQQSKSTKVINLSQIWEDAVEKWDSEGDDTPVKAALITGQIENRFGEESFKNYTDSFREYANDSDEQKQIANDMVGIIILFNEKIYKPLKADADAYKELSEATYKSIVNEYKEREALAKKPYNIAIRSIIRSAPRNPDQLWNLMAEVLPETLNK